MLSGRLSLASLPPVPLEATLPPSGIHRTCLIGKHGDMASPWHGPVLNKLYKQGDQPKPETKRRIRCGPIRYGIQKRHSAAQRTDVSGGGSPTKSPRRTRSGESHVIHARTPAPGPVGVDPRRFFHAAHTRERPGRLVRTRTR
jgi:hypothetical protein